jgi:hypothetical protein
VYVLITPLPRSDNRVVRTSHTRCLLSRLHRRRVRVHTTIRTSGRSRIDLELVGRTSGTPTRTGVTQCRQVDTLYHDIIDCVDCTATKNLVDKEHTRHVVNTLKLVDG